MCSAGPDLEGHLQAAQKSWSLPSKLRGCLHCIHRPDLKAKFRSFKCCCAEYPRNFDLVIRPSQIRSARQKQLSGRPKFNPEDRNTSHWVRPHCFQIFVKVGNEALRFGVALWPQHYAHTQPQSHLHLHVLLAKRTITNVQGWCGVHRLDTQHNLKFSKSELKQGFNFYPLDLPPCRRSRPASGMVHDKRQAFLTCLAWQHLLKLISWFKSCSQLNHPIFHVLV